MHFIHGKWKAMTLTRWFLRDHPSPPCRRIKKGTSTRASARLFHGSKRNTCTLSRKHTHSAIYKKTNEGVDMAKTVWKPFQSASPTALHFHLTSFFTYNCLSYCFVCIPEVVYCRVISFISVIPTRYLIESAATVCHCLILNLKVRLPWYHVNAEIHQRLKWLL